jgi:methylmalonyl-CoA/ethylmalonyl-CoA epimerase
MIPGAKFHHIGIITNKIKESGSKIYDPIQKVNVIFVNMGGLNIEFIEPTSNDSPIIGLLKRGTKIAHICYEVDDLEVTLQNCPGFIKISGPTYAVAFNRNIAWLFHKEYGLIELIDGKI